MPDSMIAFSNSGAISRKRLTCSSSRTPSRARRRPDCTSCDQRSRSRRQRENAGRIAEYTFATFPVGRRRQRDDAEDARADAFGDRLDDAALAGAVAALEYGTDFQPFGDDPELQFHEFSMQPGQFALVTLVVEFLPPFCAFFILGLAASALAFCRSSCVPPVFFLYITGRACLVKRQRART